MALETTPTLAGWTAFMRNNMGVTTAQLAADSMWISFCYEIALLIVNTGIAKAIPALYVQAVYNLAGDNLINFTQDVQATTPAGYWAELRKSFNINGFVSGVINSASDNGTSESMVVMDAAAQFTLANLQNLKTPYGRQYLAIAQSYGPSIWGVS